MRFNEYRDLFYKNWIFLVYLLLISYITYLGLSGINIPLGTAIIVLILLAIFTFLDRVSKDKESSKDQSQLLEKMHEQKQLLVNLKEEKKTSINLLNNLINNGVIEQEEILRHIQSSDVYCLFCFPTTIRPLRIGSGENEEQYNFGQRIYPIFLQEMGFVRVNKYSTVFITTPRRLIKEFRNVPALRDYILKK